MKFICPDEKVSVEKLDMLLENFTSVMKSLKIETFSDLEIGIIPERGEWPNKKFYRSVRDRMQLHCPVNLNNSFDLSLFSLDGEKLLIDEVPRRWLNIVGMFTKEYH